MLDVKKLPVELLKEGEKLLDAFFNLESSSSKDELINGIERLWRLLQKPEYTELPSLMYAYIDAIVLQRGNVDIDQIEQINSEDAMTRMQDVVKNWAAELRSEGMEEGIKQTILILHNLKLSLEQIVTTISENYGLTLAEARERIAKYIQ